MEGLKSAGHFAGDHHHVDEYEDNGPQDEPADNEDDEAKRKELGRIDGIQRDVT